MHHADIAAKFATERSRPLVTTPAMYERDAAYYAALELVRLIEPSPNCDGCWCVNGVWHHSLGSVVRAMLAEDGR